MLSTGKREDLTRRKLAGWLMYMIPAPIVAILYLQGVAFYEGSLAPYNLSQSFYPLSFEQALLESFLFYAQTPQYIIFAGIVLAISVIPMSLLGNVAERRLQSNNRIIKRLGLIGDWINKHISKRKGALFVPGMIISLGYGIILLMLLFAGPYSLAKNASEEKLKQQINIINNVSGTATADIKNEVTVIIENGNNPILKSGIMIKASERMITLLTREGLITFPIDKIESVIYKLPNKANSGNPIVKDKRS